MATRKTNKTEKLIKKLNKQTEKDNTAFQKMSAAEKRVAIAEDVIKSLKKSRFRATTGTYVETNWIRDEKLDKQIEAGTIDGNQKLDLKSLLKANSPPMEVTVALMYAETFPDARERMVRIMKNIIRNKGTFVCKVDL